MQKSTIKQFCKKQKHIQYTPHRIWIRLVPNLACVITLMSYLSHTVDVFHSEVFIEFYSH